MIDDELFKCVSSVFGRKLQYIAKVLYIKLSQAFFTIKCTVREITWEIIKMCSVESTLWTLQAELNRQ